MGFLQREQRAEAPVRVRLCRGPHPPRQGLDFLALVTEGQRPSVRWGVHGGARGR